MPDEKEPKEKPVGGPGAKLGEFNAEGGAGVKQDYGKSEKGWGDQKQTDGGGNEGKPERQIGIGPVYKKTFIDTDADKAHQEKYSSKEGDNDLNYASLLNTKVTVEAGSAAYDPDKKVAKATLINAKAEFVAVHGQVGLKVDVGKTVGDAIKDLLFDDVKVPGPNPPSPPAPMAARVGDMTSHLAPLLPGPGSPNVLIGGMPAWRVGLDIHACPAPGMPHGPGPTTPGATTVLINGAPAARASDFVVEPAGGPDVIMVGCPTVMIGLPTPSPAGGPKKAPRGWFGGLVESALDMMSGLVLFESVPSVDIGKGEAEAKIEGELDAKNMGGRLEGRLGAMAAVLKGEIPVKIRYRIPFTNQFLGVGATVEGSLLSLGAEANAGAKINEPGGKKAEFTWGAKAGAGLAGVGIKGNVDVAEAGDGYPHLAPKGPESAKAPGSEGGGS